MEYGLSDSPDFKELLKITKILLNFIKSKSFDQNLESPVYTSDSYLTRIIRIGSSLLDFYQQKLNTPESYKEFFLSIMERFQDERRDYIWDLMSK